MCPDSVIWRPCQNIMLMVTENFKNDKTIHLQRTYSCELELHQPPEQRMEIALQMLKNLKKY
jgi:hypothetical protein